MALVVEFGPAKGGGHGTAKQHGVEQNESTDGGVGVFAENHEGHEPHGGSTKVKLASGPVSHGYADDTEQGVESAHESEVELGRVFLARFEFKGAIVACQDAGQAN